MGSIGGQPYTLWSRKIYCSHLPMENGLYESYLRCHANVIWSVHRGIAAINTIPGLILLVISWVLIRRMVISHSRSKLFFLTVNETKNNMKMNEWEYEMNDVREFKSGVFVGWNWGNERFLRKSPKITDIAHHNWPPLGTDKRSNRLRGYTGSVSMRVRTSEDSTQRSSITTHTSHKDTRA